jgi:hypothetical protein
VKGPRLEETGAIAEPRPRKYGKEDDQTEAKQGESVGDGRNSYGRGQGCGNLVEDGRQAFRPDELTANRRGTGDAQGPPAHGARSDLGDRRMIRTSAGSNGTGLFSRLNHPAKPIV